MMLEYLQNKLICNLRYVYSILSDFSLMFDVISYKTINNQKVEIKSIIKIADQTQNQTIKNLNSTKYIKNGEVKEYSNTNDMSVKINIHKSLMPMYCSSPFKVSDLNKYIKSFITPDTEISETNINTGSYSFYLFISDKLLICELFLNNNDSIKSVRYHEREDTITITKYYFDESKEEITYEQFMNFINENT